LIGRDCPLPERLESRAKLPVAQLQRFLEVINPCFLCLIEVPKNLIYVAQVLLRLAKLVCDGLEDLRRDAADIPNDGSVRAPRDRGR
jgi:hypothetical protein